MAKTHHAILKTLNLTVGSVFLAYAGDGGPATIPGAKGPVGANLILVPQDELSIIMLMMAVTGNVEQRVATGFHRNALTNREGGVDTEEFRIAQVIDRTNAVGTTWLGLTVGCAQCHDHKYDPISQKDYYRLSAFFNTAIEQDIERQIKGFVGVSTKVRVVEPGTVQRSQGKAVRVIDKRQKT